MINIPNLHFNYYGLCLIISLFVYILISIVICIKEKYKDYEVASLLALELVSWGIALLFFRSSFYALFLILIAGLIFWLITKKDASQLFSILIFSVPLIYAIGKIGCFINGCCYGIKYAGPFNVIYQNAHDAPNGISLFPVQLIETIFNIIIFIIAIIIYHKKKNIRYTLIFNLLACSIIKFTLDFLRFRNTILSLNQIFCIIFIIISIFIAFKLKKSKNKT